MTSKNTIRKIETTLVALPSGYEVKIEFPKSALYFNGELLKKYDQKVHAYNAAQRHSMGQSL